MARTAAIWQASHIDSITRKYYGDGTDVVSFSVLVDHNDREVDVRISPERASELAHRLLRLLGEEVAV